MTPRAYLVHLGLAIAYCVLFMHCYVSFLHVHFEYAGFALHARDALFLVQAVTIAVVPIVLYRGARVISSVIAVFIYLLLYVPIILTFALGTTLRGEEVTLIQMTFLVGMSALFLVDRVSLANPVFLRTSVDLMRVAALLTVLATMYVLVKYWGVLELASFGEGVYAQRFATADVGSDLVTRYLTSWLSTVLVPLCLAYGLSVRRPAYFLVGTAACLALYLAAAAKIVILLPVLFAGFYLVFFGRRLSSVFLLMAGGLLPFLGMASMIPEPNGIVFLLSSLLLWRTVGNGGQLTAAYYEFFDFHPHTNFSHVNLVQYFTHAYPYGDDGLGQVVGKFYWNEVSNANANFWATDGIAAMGLPGVLVSSVACAGLLLVMNAVTRGYQRMFVALCFIPLMVSVLNTSLFSTMWSGGGAFLLLFLLFNRADARLADTEGDAGERHVVSGEGALAGR